MAAPRNQTDPLSRLLILIGGFVAVVALTLSIVGTATYSWYYNQIANGNTRSYNFFTLCAGNLLNSTSTCNDIARDTTFGIGTEQAAGLLVVSLCLLGLGMLISLAMNFIQLTGFLAFISPIVLFLAALFMLGALAQGSRVTLYNSYSASLVQTGHLLTILSMGFMAFASGRMHVQHFQ